MAFAVAVLWLRYAALPHIDQYRGRIFSSIEKASGMAVSARRIEGGWEGLRPHLSLEGFEIADAQGRVAVGFERAEVTLSWWALLRGRVRFHDVDFYRPLLELRRGLDGRLYLADQPLDRTGGGGDDAFTQWLLSQPRLGIHDATLVWRDDLSDAPEVRLTDVQIAVRQRLGAHRASLTARPPAGLGSRIDLRCDVRVTRPGARYAVTGKLFGQASDADLAALRTHVALPDTLRSGVGNLRVWAGIGTHGVDELVADLRVRDARAQLDTDAQPLDVESLSTRAVYQARPDGFSVATQGLRFRLPGADETVPGNFSLSRTAPRDAPPHVEVGADKIDLKIAATLLEYMPVPRELRAQVVRFAPRGRLEDAALSWTGDDAAHAKAYELRGRFSGLAVNAVDRFPGASGLTGHIEGTQAGGHVEIESREVTLDLPTVFAAPIAFDTLHGSADWKSAPAGLSVDVKSLRFASADAAGEASGTWHAETGARQHGPGIVDLKGHLERARGMRVAAYLPNGMAPLRGWVERAVQAGDASNVRFEMKGDLATFPWANGSDGRFLVTADVKGARLKYLPDWPPVDAIDGTLRLENRRIEIHSDSAAIFSSRISPAVAVIEDTAVRPVRLQVEGDVDTTGADGIRFLRESPLANGPGAFTRTVSVDGPAHLKLKLDVPLAPGEVTHVAGDLQLAGDTARAGNSLVMRDVRGRLAFSERGVRAQDLTGTLFDEPARLSFATQPDGMVATTLEGRVGAPTIAAYAPAFVAPRLQGAVAWRARMLSGAQANELTISSDLRGLGVTLPKPFAKDADEARPVTLSIANLGTERETTRVALDGGIFGRFARRGDSWNAAVRFGAPLPDTALREGLWISGQLPDLDADAWRSLFAAAAASSPAATHGAMEFNGFDLKLAHLHFLGHDFADMHAALERRQGQWGGHVEGPSVAGDVTWDPAGTGRVTGRLERLAVSEGTPGAAGADAPVPVTPTNLPAIDITAKRFDFRGHFLGELTLAAQPAGDEWRIDRLDISNEHSQFHSSGGWRRTGNGSLTKLSIKLDAENLSALFKQFGYGDYIRRGSGALEGDLAWNGYPHEFSLAGLAGTMHVEGRRGQFAKIPTGAGKLLGLLSLQSLPRRALFDFRDIFGEGFAFERIQGDVKVARGVLLADAFEISGPAAFVSLSGAVSLPQETQDLNMRVIPEVSEGVALAATVFGTPVLGLSTLVLSKLLKNPLGKAVAYEYHVTGSWDNPQVERLSAPTQRAGTSASADAPSAAVTNPE